MASVSPITNFASNYGSSDSVSGPQQVLSQNDFLQLLVTQMENQDPLNPQSDTQMAAEMAQFTALQTSSASSSSLAMMQANSLVGSTVNLQTTPGSSDTTSGVVQGIVMQNGTPEIVVNGTPYTLSQVLAVIPTAANTNNPGSGSTSPGTTGQ